MSKVIYIIHEEHAFMIGHLRNQRCLGIKVRGGYQPRHAPQVWGALTAGCSFKKDISYTRLRWASFLPYASGDLT